MAATQSHQDKMDISTTSVLSTISSTAAKKSSKSLELATSTIRAPPHAYIHLQLLSSSPPSGLEEQIDALQVKSYCSAALKQFLGLHGTAISFDILKVEDSEGWIRVSRDDLAAF
ncbi:hypothetical protein Micbo1qcDRAFT_160712, partial [Microdochium bolleyi]